MLIIVFGALGVILMSLFVGAYAVPQLKSIFKPHPWALYPPPAEYELIDVHYNKTCEAHATYSYTGSVEVRKLEVKIDSFSGELQLLTINNETITAPYPWHVTYRKVEGRPVAWEFQIIAPNKTAEYEINLRYIVSNSWLSLREYPQRIRVRVTLMPHKQKPEEILTVALDKERYNQNDTMTITIQNISNETIWFTDAAYNLVFDRFDPMFNDWVFHMAPIAALVMTPLEPAEIAQLRWRIDEHIRNPFPLGRYRVGTHGVYAEFEVMNISKTELETIVMAFLETTDVANVVWNETIEILEIYDHEAGGKVIVVNYTTVNAGHPHFMWEAIEQHTAVITLNERGEVVSAFCSWSSFHEGRIWDLINQRWIRD